MMKFFAKPFKFIFGLSIFLLIIVFSIIFLGYKSTTPPKVSEVELNINKQVNDEVDKIFKSSDKNAFISIDTKYINYEIQKQLIENLEESIDPNYIYSTEYIKLQGVWIKTNKDSVDINASVHLTYKKITYKTTLSIKISVKDIDDYIVTLKLSKVKVGNIPLKWSLNAVSRFINIEEILVDMIGDFGEFDRKKLEIKFDSKLLIDNLYDQNLIDKESVDLLSFVANTNLVKILINNENKNNFISLNINVNKLINEKDSIKLNSYDKIKDDSELEELLESKVLSSIIKYGNKVQLTEYDINIILDYMLIETIGNEDVLMEDTLFDDFKITVLKPFIEVNNEIVLNIPFRLYKEKDYIESFLEISLDPVKNNNDLLLMFNKIRIGEIFIEYDIISEFINLDQIEFLNNQNIVIEDFFSNIDEYDINFDTIIVENNSIIMKFTELEILDMFEDILIEIDNEVFEEVLGTLLDKAKDIEDFNDIEDLFTEEELNDLVNNLTDEYITLTKEEQDKIVDIINGYLGEFDFDDFN